VAFKAGIPRRRQRHGHPCEDSREETCVGRKIAVLGESVSVSLSAPWNASLTLHASNRNCLASISDLMAFPFNVCMASKFHRLGLSSIARRVLITRDWIVLLAAPRQTKYSKWKTRWMLPARIVSISLYSVTLEHSVWLSFYRLTRLTGIFFSTCSLFKFRPSCTLTYPACKKVSIIIPYSSSCVWLTYTETKYDCTM